MDMFDKINELYDKRRQVELGGGDERIERQHDRGKMTARERIDYLLVDKFFVKLNAYVQTLENHLQVNISRPNGEGVVIGVRTINGRRVYLFAQDFTVYGGALVEMHGKKIAAVMDLAAKNKVPL